MSSQEDYQTPKASQAQQNPAPRTIASGITTLTSSTRRTTTPKPASPGPAASPLPSPGPTQGKCVLRRHAKPVRPGNTLLSTRGTAEGATGPDTVSAIQHAGIPEAKTPSQLAGPLYGPGVTLILYS